MQPALTELDHPVDVVAEARYVHYFMWHLHGALRPRALLQRSLVLVAAMAAMSMVLDLVDGGDGSVLLRASYWQTILPFVLGAALLMPLAGALFGARQDLALHQSHGRGALTLRPTREGLHLAGPGTHSLLRWNAFKSVETRGRSIGLLMPLGLHEHPLLVPATAFRHAAHRAVFLEAVHAGIREAAVSPAPAPEPDGPDALCVDVRLRLTDLMPVWATIAFAHRGVQVVLATAAAVWLALLAAREGLVALPLSDPVRDLLGFLAPVVLALVLVGIPLVNVAVQAYGFRREGARLLDYTLQADAGGLSLTSVRGASRLAWSDVHAAREGSRAFTLYPRREVAFVVPKRDLADEAAVQAFRALLRERLGDRARVREERPA